VGPVLHGGLGDIAEPRGLTQGGEKDTASAGRAFIGRCSADGNPSFATVPAGGDQGLWRLRLSCPFALLCEG